MAIFDSSDVINIAYRMLDMKRESVSKMVPRTAAKRSKSASSKDDDLRTRSLFSDISSTQLMVAKTLVRCFSGIAMKLPVSYFTQPCSSPQTRYTQLRFATAAPKKEKIPALEVSQNAVHKFSPHRQFFSVVSNRFGNRQYCAHSTNKTTFCGVAIKKRKTRYRESVPEFGLFD